MNTISDSSRAFHVSNDSVSAHAVSTNSVSAARQRLPVFAPAPVPVSEQGDVADSQEPETLVAFAQRQGKPLLAGWATSLLLHLFLMGVLAVFTFGGASTQLGLELAFSDAPESVELEDVQFEMPVLEELDFPEHLEMIPEEVPEDPGFELEESVVALAESAIETATLSSESMEPMSESESSDGDGGVLSVEPGAKFYGIEMEGNRFVFVIDASTSMLEGGRWGRAVNELLEAISQLKSSQEFLVMTYNSGFRPMLNMPRDQIDLVRATRGNKRRLANWLHAQYPNGVTMPAGAMMVGLNLNVDAIYLLSDGLLMDRTDSMLRQHNRPRQARFGAGQKTPVHTIAMDMDGDGADMLRVIAEENAGIFRVVE
ncbi:VWA domain-containing protein [Mariniblastus sp.]|nr:VWA domain-containing protein [Mariniblastus sp.]